MKISEVIEELQAIQAEHGDIMAITYYEVTSVHYISFRKKDDDSVIEFEYAEIS